MPSPLSAGASFGPFHLIKKLGSGGQAEVWAARKPLAGVERIFAVKLAWSENVDDPRLNELVLREARVLGLLAGHPNIIGVTEFGILPGCFYLQMDYAHGWDLQKILGNGTRFPVEIALHIVACACAALEFAHSPHGEDGRRIIHRDIKPANILITHWGDVKLVDFGVAKLLSERQTITRIAGTFLTFPPRRTRSTAARRRDTTSLRWGPCSGSACRGPGCFKGIPIRRSWRGRSRARFRPCRATAFSYRRPWNGSSVSFCKRSGRTVPERAGSARGDPKYS
jgi:serine/threonine protein kinase